MIIDGNIITKVAASLYVDLVIIMHCADCCLFNTSVELRLKMADLNLKRGALPGEVRIIMLGYSKWGVAWELGSSLGVEAGSA